MPSFIASTELSRTPPHPQALREGSSARGEGTIFTDGQPARCPLFRHVYLDSKHPAKINPCPLFRHMYLDPKQPAAWYPCPHRAQLLILAASLLLCRDRPPLCRRPAGGSSWQSPSGLFAGQGADGASLIAAFDAVRRDHEAMSAEAYNDDHVFKRLLNLVSFISLYKLIYIHVFAS